MVRIINIVDSTWFDNSNKKMLHTLEDGTEIVGPIINCDNKVIVELSSDRMDDGYYHIVKVHECLNK